MASQNTQVYCFGASTWTSVFAWLQIVTAVFGIVGISVVLADMDDTRNEFVNKRRRQPVGVIISLLVFAVVNLVLGILLLMGNKREKFGLLWAWLILYFIDAAFGFFVGSAVMIAKVGKRIEDIIEIGSGQTPADGA